MTLSIYLNFNGNCRQAFDFYRSAFGGDYITISTFGEGPDDMGMPEDELDRIMHVSLPIGDSVLMGSDTSAAFGPPHQAGNNFSVSCHPKSREETERLFAAISAGGTVTMPLDDMFWGSYFGACVDKFGIPWQFNHDIQHE
ncbi:MAG: VOC family protein [Caldilineaceae bacterium]|nr:VOC family protein [Caldilineaceae bacterium]